MKFLYGDLESFSCCNLKTAGAHRYAEDPTTEVLVNQWALDDGPVHVEDLTGRQRPSKEFLALLHDPEVVCVYHNSGFDRTIMRHVWRLDIPAERWLDTMVVALAHSLPGALGKVGEVLGLDSDEAKDRRGARLIGLFCKEQPAGNKLRRATRDTHPTEWAEFLQYSHQDIVAMRAIHRRLPAWNFGIGHPEHRLWCLDQKTNDRGIAVDLDLAEAALRETALAQKTLARQVQEHTSGAVEKATKRDQMLKHILAEYGVELPDLKKATLERRMADPELPEGARILLAIRLEASMTSVGKYKAFTNATCTDGRLRGALQFGGANRTNRWSGRIVQLQNMPRPTMAAEEIDMGIELLKAGCPEVLFPDVMTLAGNAVRGSLIAPHGRKLCIADLSNIEGRGLVGLSGEQWKLDAFRAFDAGVGSDMYILAYARALGIDTKGVSKYQRQIGKVMELGLGFGGGVAAFLTFAAVYGLDLEVLADAVHAAAAPELRTDANSMWGWAQKQRRTLGLSQHVYTACEILKRAWRDAHPCTEALWGQAGKAFEQATQNPGTVFEAGPLRFRRDGAWLRVRLPSGRYLCYLQPKVEDGQCTYMGTNQYTRQWARIKTYGGKICENATQAWARDVLAHNMPAVEHAGYEIVLSVHDELLTETPDTDEYSHETLATLMATNPPWAQHVPLAAAGFSCYRYRKE